MAAMLNPGLRRSVRAPYRKSDHKDLSHSAISLAFVSSTLSMIDVTEGN